MSGILVPIVDYLVLFRLRYPCSAVEVLELVRTHRNQFTTHCIINCVL